MAFPRRPIGVCRRRPGTLVGVLVLLLLLAIGAVSNGPDGSAATPAATLRIESQSPLIVRGTHFRPGEHVVVTGLARGGARRLTVTARNGTFRVTVAPPSRGGPVTAVRAKGDRGSEAYVATGRDSISIPPPIR
jgi:hypothetical protein